MNALAVLALALVYSVGVSGVDSSTAVPSVTTAEVTLGPGTEVVPTTTTVVPDGQDDKPPPVNLTLSQNNIVCLMVSMRAKFNFTYNQTIHKGNETTHETVYWDLPSDTTVLTDESRCNATSDGNNQLLVAEFFEGWRLKMYFSRNKDKEMKVDNVTLNYIESSVRFHNITMPNSNVSSTAHSSDFTWNEDGFKCTSEEKFSDFSRGNMTQISYMQTTDVEIEAFRNKKDAVFGKKFSYCANDTKVSNIVPIAVGAALAGLVLIVLVAYLIGRSRNKRGYESV